MKARTAKSIGAAIKQRRIELGLGQPDLAKRIGASRHWVIDMEQGKDGVEIGRVLRALDTLGLTIDISTNAIKTSSGKADIRRIDIDSIVTRSRLAATAARKAK
jgi:HTH-type transcriptional regulator/antitoxin HipB